MIIFAAFGLDIVRHFVELMFRNSDTKMDRTPMFGSNIVF